MFSTVFHKIKNKTKKKNNYVKSVNTVKSVFFNGYTLLQYHPFKFIILILEKNLNKPKKGD